MTEKRQRMISAMKYILLVIIVGYLVILMLYASGSKRTFSEVSKAVSSVLDSKELVQMDDQMQESIRGRYIFFAVSSKASEYRSAFDKSL